MPYSENKITGETILRRPLPAALVPTIVGNRGNFSGGREYFQRLLLILELFEEIYGEFGESTFGLKEMTVSFTDGLTVRSAYFLCKEI